MTAYLADDGTMFYVDVDAVYCGKANGILDRVQPRITSVKGKYTVYTWDAGTLRVPKTAGATWNDEKVTKLTDKRWKFDVADDHVMASTCFICSAFTCKACSRCKTVNYCSAGCQTADWGAHKKVCFKPATRENVLASLTEMGMDREEIQERLHPDAPEAVRNDMAAKLQRLAKQYTGV
jgi:hypothetical protein